MSYANMPLRSGWFQCLHPGCGGMRYAPAIDHACRGVDEHPHGPLPMRPISEHGDFANTLGLVIDDETEGWSS